MPPEAYEGDHVHELLTSPPRRTEVRLDAAAAVELLRREAAAAAELDDGSHEDYVEVEWVTISRADDLPGAPRALLEAATTTKPIITIRTADVLQIIKSQSERGTGITGPAICAELEKQGIIMEPGTLTRDHIPVLKQHFGVKNKPRVGYYIETGSRE